MKAVNFPEQTSEMSNNNPDYYNVPSYNCDDAFGTVIMKIEVTPEEWEKVKEQGFSFWYTRQTGGRGLQPFSFRVETPFVLQYQMVDLSPEALETLLQQDSQIGNFHVGKDVVLFQVIVINGDNVSIKRFNHLQKTESTSMMTYKSLSELMLSSEYSSQFFIINPKGNG